METALKACMFSSVNPRTPLKPYNCFNSDFSLKSNVDVFRKTSHFLSNFQTDSNKNRLKFKSRDVGIRMSMEEAGRENDNGSRILATGGINGLGSGTASGFAVPEMLKILQIKLDEAKSRENYAEASKIRDLMHALEEKDPIIQAKLMLNKAIAEERYSDAATYRDELKKLEALLEKGKKKNLQCFSDTVTQGVRVRVRSIFVKDRSLPDHQQYFFAYRLRISNESDRTVQLLNRHWVITDANGHVEEVRGPGVIGEQPVLRPGTSFEYTSACPLRTPSGTMEGEYEMICVDESFPSSFQVQVGIFALNVNDDDEE